MSVLILVERFNLYGFSLGEVLLAENYLGFTSSGYKWEDVLANPNNYSLDYFAKEHLLSGHQVNMAAVEELSRHNNTCREDKADLWDVWDKPQDIVEDSTRINKDDLDRLVLFYGGEDEEFTKKLRYFVNTTDWSNQALVFNYWP